MLAGIAEVIAGRFFRIDGIGQPPPWVRWPFRRETPPPIPKPILHYQLWVLPNPYSVVWQKSLYVGTDHEDAVVALKDVLPLVHQAQIRVTLDGSPRD